MKNLTCYVVGVMILSAGVSNAWSEELRFWSAAGDTSIQGYGPDPVSYVNSVPQSLPLAFEDPGWGSPATPVNPSFTGWGSLAIGEAEWISPMSDFVGGDQYAWFWYRKTFELPPNAINISGSIQVTADNREVCYLNGTLIGGSASGPDPNWGIVQTYDMTTQLTPGENLLDINVYNWGGPDGLIFLAEITYDLAPEVVEVGVDIDPDTLNLSSKGKSITAYVELPEGCTGDTVDLNLGGVSGTSKGVNDDGLLVVKFDRAEVQALLSPGEATLTVSGTIDDKEVTGSDTIRVIEKGGKK